ncbi:Golgi integral membrane protein 4-like isoform X1 [Branchiostoma lanceolatum]|uniref:Golgi integral membrane protein 4-like isoform X1 n=1 Tax=Branchiostoma lanceolatum TaxID=7740 RepID=UPI00345624DA
MREDVSMICARRGQGKWQTLIFVLVLVGFGYGVYEYNQLQIRHQHAEHRSQKYQSQQESLSAQLQVVYEHRSRLEKSLQKERNEHKKTREEYEQKQIESEQVLAKEKQEAENRYDSLNQQYKMLRNQHEDLEREYASLQDQHVRLGDEHKKIVDQHLDNYQKLKDQKDTDLQRLKDVIQNLKDRNAQLTRDQEELVKQITISQDGQRRLESEKQELLQLISEQRTAVAAAQSQLEQQQAELEQQQVELDNHAVVQKQMKEKHRTAQAELEQKLTGVGQQKQLIRQQHPLQQQPIAQHQAVQKPLVNRQEHVAQLAQKQPDLNSKRYVLGAAAAPGAWQRRQWQPQVQTLPRQQVLQKHAPVPYIRGRPVRRQQLLQKENVEQPGAQQPFVQVPGAGEDLDVGGGLHPGLDETHKQLLEAQKRRQELQNQFRDGLGLPDENAIQKDKLGDKKDNDDNQIIHQDGWQVGKVGNGDGKDDLDDQDSIQNMRGRSNFIGQQLAGNLQDGSDQLLAGGDRLQPLGDDPDKQLQLQQVGEENQVQPDDSLHHPLDAGDEDDAQQKDEDGQVLDQDDLEVKGLHPLGQAGEEAVGGQDAQPGDQGPFALGQDMDQDQPEQQGAAPLGMDQPMVKHEVEVLVPGGQESDQQMMQVERPDQNLPQVAVDHEVQVDHPLAGGGQVADNNIQPVVQLPNLMPVQNRDGDNMADPVNDDNRGMQDVDKDFDDGNEDQANDQVEGGVGDGHGDDDDDDDDDDREPHDGIGQVKAGGDIRQREDQDEFQNDYAFGRRHPLSHPLNRIAR